VVAASVMGVLLAMTVGAIYVGSAVVARHRAQAAADMAALAGAAALPGGSEVACQRASVVGRAMGGTVTACSTDELDLVVIVDVQLGLPARGLGSAGAVARAGPLDTN
jgi:secretion/DNA translocation related TadE-like protein